MESIYGEHISGLESSMNYLLEEINVVRERLRIQSDFDPVEHLNYRIKGDRSMREKCRRKGIPETAESAIRLIHDAIGIRVVCAFISDVYKIRDHLVQLPDCTVVEEKDYILHAKDNGYRSYHLILKLKTGYFAEIQLRTISQDTWAALEHHIHYKKDKTAEDLLISAELKRCADELASTDLSMQTLRDLIRETQTQESSLEESR